MDTYQLNLNFMTQPHSITKLRNEIGFSLTLFTAFSFIVVGFLIGVSYFSASASAQAATTNQLAANINESYFTEGQDATNETMHSQLLAQAEDRSIDIGTQQSSSNQCNYLTDNLRIDFNNDTEQVLRLQAFLKVYAYDSVELTGQFGETTLRAVENFQRQHADDVLEPWGYESDEPTGYVYITTRKKINEIYCGQNLSLSQSDQTEIQNYRQKLNRWRAQGASFETPEYLANYYQQQPDVGMGGADVSINEDSEAGSVDSGESMPEGDNVISDELVRGNDTVATASGEVSVTATDTETDDRGFFAQLFGVGDDESEEGSNDGASNNGTSSDSSTTTTSTESAMATTATQSAATTATSGVDQAATSVYSGVNSVVNFLLSPTFLLILLAVLILLLIATLLEDDEDGTSDLSFDTDDSPSPQENTDKEDVSNEDAFEEYDDMTTDDDSQSSSTQEKKSESEVFADAKRDEEMAEAAEAKTRTADFEEDDDATTATNNKSTTKKNTDMSSRS